VAAKKATRKPTKKTDPRVRSWRRRGIEITPEEYDERLAKQGGVCAICLKPPKKLRLAVDHDHVSGLVRGLLCHRCNRYLIAKHRTPHLLLAGAKYLAEHLASQADA
jgi:hypothetical protein